MSLKLIGTKKFNNSSTWKLIIISTISTRLKLFLEHKTVHIRLNLYQHLPVNCVAAQRVTFPLKLIRKRHDALISNILAIFEQEWSANQVHVVTNPKYTRNQSQRFEAFDWADFRDLIIFKKQSAKMGVLQVNRFLWTVIVTAIISLSGKQHRVWRCSSKYLPNRYFVQFLWKPTWLVPEQWKDETSTQVIFNSVQPQSSFGPCLSTVSSKPGLKRDANSCRNSAAKAFTILRGLSSGDDEFSYTYHDASTPNFMFNDLHLINRSKMYTALLQFKWILCLNRARVKGIIAFCHLPTRLIW